MLRILRFSTLRPLTPQDSLQALEAAEQAARAAEKVPGVKSCTLYLGSGSLVFTAESDGYAAADAALQDPNVQLTFGRLGQQFGYAISGDEFLLEPKQVYPFIQK